MPFYTVQVDLNRPEFYGLKFKLENNKNDGEKKTLWKSILARVWLANCFSQTNGKQFGVTGRSQGAENWAQCLASVPRAAIDARYPNSKHCPAVSANGLGRLMDHCNICFQFPWASNDVFGVDGSTNAAGVKSRGGSQTIPLCSGARQMAALRSPNSRLSIECREETKDLTGLHGLLLLSALERRMESARR
ncbi:hypothetical protein ElyMa_006428300 [Elysia marginata]|uniref:Uncharacterized protein n=1 Tax=Elysia marginata TaxID=1093978 RepID=A0AAV4HVI8_9GAST|nr:hypothetical protein ElyMa_006428300 [Elysia marginata]